MEGRKGRTVRLEIVGGAVPVLYLSYLILMGRKFFRRFLVIILIICGQNKNMQEILRVEPLYTVACIAHGLMHQDGAGCAYEAWDFLYPRSNLNARF